MIKHEFNMNWTAHASHDVTRRIWITGRMEKHVRLFAGDIPEKEVRKKMLLF
jgi:hypothetical protein